jgi:hypothetical protein
MFLLYVRNMLDRNLKPPLTSISLYGITHQKVLLLPVTSMNNHLSYLPVGSQDSAIAIVTGYGLDSQQGKIFSSPQCLDLFWGVMATRDKVTRA